MFILNLHSKRKVVYFIIIIMILSIIFPVSCSKTEQKQENNQEKFDIKAASNVAESYMKAVEKGNMEGIKKLYSKNLLAKTVDEENKEFKITGFNITETSKIGETGLFKVRVARSGTKESFAALDEYIIKVVKEGFDYKIDDTKSNPLKEAFPIEGKVRLKSKNNVDTNLLFDINSIPNFAFSKDDKSNMDKLPVPKSKFGIMAFSYDGNKLALTTTDTGFFAGYIKIDETLEVQGGDDQGEKKGTNGGKSQGSSAKEKPVGKELVVLDVVKDSKINNITFSQDEKYIVVEYNKGNAGKTLRVFKTNNGDLLDFRFEKSFPINLVDVNYSFLDKDTLYFEITSRKSDDKDAKPYVGKWQLDLKELKAKKV